MMSGNWNKADFKRRPSRQEHRQTFRPLEGRHFFGMENTHKPVPPLLPLESFSECFSWPSKISFVLFSIREGTAEDISAEIVELEGIASEDGVTEVQHTVKEMLEKLHILGKITCREDSGKRKYALITN